MLDLLLSFLQGLPSWLVVAIVAMTPILELRGAIPLALGVYHYPWWLAFLLSVVGNMVPPLLILLGWDSVISLLEKRFPVFHGFMSRYHDRLHTKWQDKIDRYGPWALALFVAVPLPMSGVWSGALIAWVFGLHRRPALLSIFVGVLVAAVIVTAVTTGTLRLF